METTVTLSPTDANALARAAQDEVPFCPRPFDELAVRVGIRPEDALETLRAWHEERKLREISAVLEGSLLGYESALCAARVPESDLDRVAEVVNAHPTVTHNYERRHAYNLWFTIAVPHAMGLDETLARLEARSGVCILPARRTQTFKIGVNFDLLSLESRTAAREPEDAPEAAPFQPTAREERFFRVLQSPLPLVERPFAVLADQAECPENELLDFARRHLGGAIRRYVATFRQRHLGVRGNAMVVWRVPDDELQDAGRRLARAPEVSHCYARETLPDFPYALYSMVHAADEPACRAIVARLAGIVGTEDYAMLVSTREFKKCRLRYFLPELERWWAQDCREVVA